MRIIKYVMFAIIGALAAIILNQKFGWKTGEKITKLFDKGKNWVSEKLDKSSGVTENNENNGSETATE